jgi:hypothetical protein
MLPLGRPLQVPPGVTAPSAKGSPRRSAGLTGSKSWSQALSIRENRYAPAKSVALWQRGSKLMLGSSSWNPSRQVRAMIAVGLFIIGAVVVWATFAGPSIPDSVLAPVPNGDGMPSTSPSSTKANRERSKEGADHVRDQITGCEQKRPRHDRLPRYVSATRSPLPSLEDPLIPAVPSSPEPVSCLNLSLSC